MADSSSQADTGTQICWIDVMDDPTILQIMDLLDFKDRIVLERVSKRWQLLVKKSWRSVTEMTLCAYFTVNAKLRTFSKTDIVLDRACKFESILLRCGPSVRKLTLHGPYDPEDLRMSFFKLKPVGRLCTSLISIRFVRVSILPQHLRSLIPLGPQVRAIAFDNCRVEGYSVSPAAADTLAAFSELLASCNALEKFEIGGSGNWVDEVLPMLPQGLRAFQLKNPEIRLDRLLLVLQNHSNIRDLSLEISKNLEDANSVGIEAVIARIPNVEVLTLYADRSQRQLKLTSLGSLHALRELGVNNLKSFDDEALKSVCRGCPDLKVLWIAGTSVTDDALKNLGQLKCLEVLDIRGKGYWFSKTPFAEMTKYFGNLKELWFHWEGFSKTLESLAVNCPNLESVNMQVCGKSLAKHLLNFAKLIITGRRSTSRPCRIRNLDSISVTDLVVSPDHIPTYKEFCHHCRTASEYTDSE